jgi:hypothetical protein
MRVCVITDNDIRERNRLIMAGTWVRLYPRKKVPIHVNCLILIDFFLFLDETGVVLVVPEENILT